MIGGILAVYFVLAYVTFRLRPLENKFHKIMYWTVFGVSKVLILAPYSYQGII